MAWWRMWKEKHCFESLSPSQLAWLNGRCKTHRNWNHEWRWRELAITALRLEVSKLSLQREQKSKILFRTGRHQTSQNMISLEIELVHGEA